MIKINGKLSTTNIYLIKPKKNVQKERNLLADEFEYNSSAKNYTPPFQKYKQSWKAKNKLHIRQYRNL